MASEDTLFSQKKINANVKGLKKILKSHVKKKLRSTFVKKNKDIFVRYKLVVFSRLSFSFG